MDVNPRALEIVQALADPLRFAILLRLMSGPASVSDLVSGVGQSQSKVSNHLALLRERGIVHAKRTGRAMIYEIADASYATIIESLVAVAGESIVAERPAPLAKARTCYDHLAGRLGVAIFDALVEQKALLAPARSAPNGALRRSGLGTIELGPKAVEVFERIGVDLDLVAEERRQFASACVDWTERRPHLGGALGAAIWARAHEQGWVVRKPGTRAVVLTASGKRVLARVVGLDVTLLG